MKLQGILSFLFIFSYAAMAGSQPQINPSGVWSMWDWNMNYTKAFSWGENPVNNEVVVIDLGAEEPYIDVAVGEFKVSSYRQEGYRFIFEGGWGTMSEELIPGNLVAVYSEDGNSLYFESIKPEKFGAVMELGETNRYFRVPVDAPVVPIGPEGP
ncbi:exported hypothetical protein [uncultured spirochete]|uniref:Uncharacterized protein n=1 Tax=uncultured spirochete TaxID=156406 RepID=A0A3P3XP20_9SPIR|nr:exported hypothetical protein [uncultured spirochete]